jgi:hypothetical protein
MVPHHTISSANFVTVSIVGIVGWYLYQVGSRKKELIRFKIRRATVALATYTIVALVLIQQKLNPIEAIIFAMLAGMGSGWLLVNPPKNERRIPKAVRRAVIDRDLTSKGLKWDRNKHHIDHVVPYSRGGDHSTRNLRVLEKERNLRKGSRMPSFWDFLKR